MPIQDTDRLPTIAAFLIIIVLMAGFVPSLIDNTSDIATQTVTQTEGNEHQLTGYLSADLTNVRDGMSFTEISSIHTTDTDFNGAETLDNVTVEGSGESADVRLSAGIVNSDDFESSVPAGYTQVAAIPGMQGSNAAEVDTASTFYDMLAFSPIESDQTFRVQMAGQDNSGDEIFALFDGSGTRGPQVAQRSGTWQIFESGSYTDTGVSYSLDTAYELVFTNIDTSTDTFDLDIVRLSDSATVYSANGLSFASDVSSIESAQAFSSSSNAEGSVYDYPRVIGDAAKGTYLSETHSVDSPTSGWVNITLSNSTAEVKWLADTDGDGTFETTVSQNTRSTAGEYTTDLSSTSGQNWRVNVTFVVTGSSPTGEIHDEGIITETTEGTDVNVTLVNSKTGQTVDTGPINESETRQFTIGMETVTVTNQDVLSDNRSLMTYEYPRYYGYSPIVAQLGELIGLIIIVIFVYLMYSIFFPEENR